MEIKLFEPWFFYSLLVAVYLSCRAPYIGVAMRVVNTMLHEFSHALVAFLFSGKIQSVKLFSNTEGEITISGNNKIVQFLTALAGYPLSALSGMGILFLVMNDYQDVALWILTAFASVLLLLFVRNLYGVIWLIVFMGINLSALLFEIYPLMSLLGLIYTFIIITEAAHSVFSLLVLSIRNPKMAGDATVLSKLTFLPAVFWALCFVGLNGFIVYFVVAKFFPFG
ncbi:MAG: M50 family metallopeptidase [Bacteroidales bacterium]|nr:M50 family metallopeptidase [Bacteroidales bacterium]MDY0216730.1 M50 family metallopeptidase [Bacteroidales bacterium]